MDDPFSTERNGADANNVTESVVVVRGARAGPSLTIVGRPGDLSAVMDRLELEGEVARLSGQLEFYTPSAEKPDPSRCLILPADETEGSLMSTSKCYLAVLDRAAKLGMREEDSAGPPWRRGTDRKAPERRTGSGWKTRQW